MKTERDRHRVEEKTNVRIHIYVHVTGKKLIVRYGSLDTGKSLAGRTGAAGVVPEGGADVL